MKVYNSDAAHGVYYDYQCNCGCWLLYKQKFCHHCGIKLDWSKVDSMENELDRRSMLPFSEKIKYFDDNCNVFVSDEEVLS